MKKLLYLTLLIGGLFITKSSDAQINVNINLSSQPLWGPVGYEYVRYYYMPEIDVYYNVASRKYTYYQGNRWVTKSKLPGKYRNIDLYRTYKVVINDRDPWHNHRVVRNKYSNYAVNRHQVAIRDARGHDHRYGKKIGKDVRYDAKDRRKVEQRMKKIEKDRSKGHRR